MNRRTWLQREHKKRKLSALAESRVAFAEEWPAYGSISCRILNTEAAFPNPQESRPSRIGARADWDRFAVRVNTRNISDTAGTAQIHRIVE
jgi:hypothetical protein